MSELTFNIADYRPLSRVRFQDGGPALKARNGFVVLSSNSEPDRYEREWREARPAVVDIRSVREAHRAAYPRRGKILRFSNPASHRLYMMPVHHDTSSMDDDPGPMVA
jgi:hypothetical protein